MQVNPQNLSMLRGTLLQSCSTHNETRKAAEKILLESQTQPGFATLLLTLVAQLVSDSPDDINTRLIGSILFKNFIKTFWDPDEEAKANIISLEERANIKTHIVDLMCSTPQLVQSQLSEAVSIIALHDFPAKWENLLPHLVSKLPSSDTQVNQGVMITANSIMKRFRHADKTDDLLADLLTCLKAFQVPLLQMSQHNRGLIESLSGNKDQLLIALETQRLMTRIFYSLNVQDLPEYFEEHMGEWMEEMRRSLEYRNPLVESTSLDEPGIIEKLQSAVLENLNLYASKYEEEFSAFLPPFTQHVWLMLCQTGPQPRYDSVATHSIKFLTSVGSKQSNTALFSPQMLQQLIEHVVVRNMHCTELDEENFEANPTDYIRKDIEGSDQDTRRRSAIELVRTLRTFFEEPISKMCIQYTGAMLQQYQASGRKEWKAQDAALHLLLACSVKTSNATVGASTLNPALSLGDIFQNFILPEITDPDVNSRPIVKADAIKMILTYRTHIEPVNLNDILPHLIRLLGSESVVIQTYSAMAIERFLALKEGGSPKIPKQILQPHIQPLFVGLFNVLENADLSENDYVMKCIMRLLISLGPDILPVLSHVLTKLTASLEKVCRQPTNPQYNHYLWEAFSVLIRSACGSSQLPCTPTPTSSQALTFLSQFEVHLNPIFQHILGNEISEFIPYVFQVLAQILSLRPRGSGLSPSYRDLLVPILSPVTWEKKQNIPSLNTLLTAYIAVGGREVIGESSQLVAILGIFQILISAKSSQPQAFLLMSSLFLHCPSELLAPHLTTIFNLLLKGMQTAVKKTKTPPYCRNFLHLLALSICVFSPQTIYPLLESLTPGLSSMLVNNVLAVNREEICLHLQDSQIRHMAVGLAKLLVLSPVSTALTSEEKALETWKSLFLSSLLCVSVLDGSGLSEGALPGRKRSAASSTLSSAAVSSLMNDDEDATRLEGEGGATLVYAQVSEEEEGGAALSPSLTAELQNPARTFGLLITELVRSQPAFRGLLSQAVGAPLQVGTPKDGFQMNGQATLSHLLQTNGLNL